MQKLLLLLYCLRADLQMTTMCWGQTSTTKNHKSFTNESQISQVEYQYLPKVLWEKVQKITSFHPTETLEIW